MAGPLRIAGASGFWGDRNEVLLDQCAGPVDVVMLDYLAEVTMSILRLKLLQIPERGYAGDFLKALDPALPWRNAVALSCVWPHAVARAPAAEALLRERAKKRGLQTNSR